MLKFSKVLLSILAVVAGLTILSWATTPSPAKVMQLALGSDRILLSSNGQVLQTLRTDFTKRRLSWFKLADFSKAMQDAVILAEDHRFRSHFGFDPIGLARAVGADLRGSRIQGASTISMQLTDLIQEDVLLHNRPITKGSLLHKFMQIARAVLLELRWSKNEILEAYLNLIHLRGEFQGVPAVSYAYLNKHPLALDANEALVIASMISSPNQSAAALKVRARALGQLGLGKNGDEIASVVDTFFRKSPVMPASPGLAPHLARRLFSQFPHETSLTSTIDLDLQAKVTAIMKKNLYRLSEQNVHDSAAIVIDNQNGRVLAYVGTLSTSESPHVDGVEAYRQAGSSLKPFIYAKAIESKTLTAASILLDDPTAISWGGQVYRPANYDQHFNGPVSAREALASSLNVPAVKTVTIIGLRQTYQVLQSIMLTNLKDPDFYGVSMALGAVEVRLDELANAYRMLANGGLWSPLHFVDSKTEKTLQALHAPESHRVFSPESAFIISSILSDPNARSIGFGWENPLETPFWTAVKTGTSKDYRDNWCAGFSERYTVAVWAGNFDAQAMHKVSGVSGVGPTWFEIMNVLHAQIRSAAPKMPSGLVAKNVRHQWSSHEHLEYFIKGSEPAQSVIEPSLDKRVQFVFPAEGSVLVKDPHLDASRIALFIRFAGQVPAGSRLVWDGKDVGEALSPFKMEAPAAGEHDLAIVAPTAANHSKDAAAGSSTNVTHVHFTIRGAE